MKRVWIVEENDGYDKYLIKAYSDISKAHEFIDKQEKIDEGSTFSLIFVDVEDD